MHAASNNEDGPVFSNDDTRLREEAAAVGEMRRASGLEGLTNGLEAVVVMTEPERMRSAAEEFISTTGLAFQTAFENEYRSTAVLGQPGGADFLICARRKGGNPFAAFNRHPKAEHLPGTRLETYVYGCRDVRAYVDIQRGRGVEFLGGVVDAPGYLYVETLPSAYTGNNLGFVQWKEEPGDWRSRNATLLGWDLSKPQWPHLRNIGRLDHSAIRVRAQDRDPAILEFMTLTSYRFDFAIYVESLNSITNVARLTPQDYAQVFTSGISPFVSLEQSGPTEKYMYNYGTRTHHLAFDTTHIEETYAALVEHGMEFLIELVGSPEDGLKQTFSQMSPNTLLVHEYIHRYGDFDGFFTRSNVTDLTRATDKQ